MQPSRRRDRVRRPALPALALLAALFFPPAAAAGDDPLPLLQVLTETGASRDGLPVFAPHPDPEATLAALSRGLPGEMLGLYRMEQRYLQRVEGREPRPAFVLLSSHQGGYARYGFWLGEARLDDVAYVDVYRDWPLVGDFGAIDQIFPHELWHAIRRQMVGAQDEGFANQVHALGVRTDRGVAFNEGFAEGLQALAVEHEDADPATRALATDLDAYTRVRADLRAYARELLARLSPATRWRTGFVLWFANGEDVLRYHGVRDNLFARAPAIPRRLLERRDPYRAYLYEAILPAAPDAPLRSPARMLATEGVMAALAYAWSNDRDLRASTRDPGFYALFDTTAGQVSPLQNVWLKIIHAAHERRTHDAAELVDGYGELFPDEAPFVERVVAGVFGTARLQLPPELWLANDEFRTGTTLFDQFRGLPRTHTFDLNAASPVDLCGVPGVDLALAERILAGAPYGSIADLTRLDGVSPALLQRFTAMQVAMRELSQQADDEEVTLSIKDILLPSLWRVVAALFGGAIGGAFLYRLVRSRGPLASTPSWLRSGINGLAAAFAGVIAGWAAGAGAGLGSLGGVGVLFGVPAGLICLGRGRGAREATFALLAWGAAALPVAVAITPWF